VFKNRVLRRLFGLKRFEVMRGLRKLHREELRNLYSSPSIISMIKSRSTRWAGYVTQIGTKRNAYRTLMGNQIGKRSLGRTGY
jgi:hypothetical protein